MMLGAAQVGAALAWLAALALPGVAALRRWTSLDRLETLVYGSALGVVAGSLLLVPLASVFGLRAWLVGILGLAALAGGLGTWRSPGPPASAGRRAIGLGVLVVLALFVARFALLCAGALVEDGSGLWAGHLHVWGDWSQHLGDVTSFAYGDNFPPTHPRFAGRPLSYHYLTSVTVAAMVSLGLPPTAALPLHSLVFLTLVTLAVFAFARRLTHDGAAAALALALFLLGGGLGWWISLRDAFVAPDPWRALWADPWNRSAQQAANFRWLDMVFAYLLPQRAILYGLPLGLLALTLLLEGGTGGRRRAFVVAGVAAGLLPLAHLGTLLALALITPFLVLVFPRRGWPWFFAVWAALALPVFLLQQGGSGGALSHLRVQVGWIARPDAWWFFWLKNLGAFVPLLLWALFEPEVVPRPGARFLWAFMPIFVIANLVVFQPWDWDNTKVFLFWYLAGCVLVAASLARAWREGGAAARAVAAVVVATLLLSGLLAHLDQALGRDRHRILTAAEMRFADEVRRVTPPHALFLVGLNHNHPVPVLTGRRVVLGYPGWMWSQGIPARAREADVRTMYALGSAGMEKLAAYGVDYLVVGPWEREHFHPDEAALGARFPRVLDVPPYALYAVGRAAR